MQNTTARTTHDSNGIVIERPVYLMTYSYSATQRAHFAIFVLAAENLRERHSLSELP